MSESFYILFSATVLSLTGWLDEMLKKLRIKKLPFALFTALLLIICDYEADIYGISFSPASFLLFAVPLSFALVSQKKTLFPWLALSSVMLTFLYAFLFLFENAEITLVSLALSLLCALLPLQPALSLSVCVTVPFIAYLLSFFGDFFFFMTNNTPTCAAVFLSQLASAVVVLFVCYAKRAVMPSPT